MKNRKGFTLAELLGVIVILLLLVLIVTPLFIKYSKNAGKTAYDVQINNIKESAKEWALDDDNAKLLPKKDDECVEVTLEKLKQEGLLDYNLKNPKTGEKFNDELTVIIRKEGKKLTYTFNEDGTQTCDTVITTDYPKWIYVSSSPSIVSDTDEVTVNITSDVKISEYNLTPDKITVKVGGKIIDDANLTVNCSNGDTLSCSVKISNLSGTGDLSLIIDKETMKDEDLNPSRITNIKTDTYVDTEGPKISYTGRENTNSSIYYARSVDTVTIKFKAEDNGSVVNNLTADDVIVYLDGTEITCSKELTTTGSGKKVEYALKLTNVTGNGKVSIKIPSGKILDNKGNTNNEKVIIPGITFDNVAPTITYNPNETVGYVQKMKAIINVTDNETGVNEETIKYIFTTDTTATPNIPISNGGLIEKKELTGEYYIIGYACDYAGNCTDNADTLSGIYHMNNSGPRIEIVPDHNAGYAKTATVNIKATSRGGELDEGSLKYTISTDINAPVNTMYTNNSNVSISDLTGEYYVIAEACDTLGNCTRETSDKFYFDNQTPTVQYNPDGKGWSKSVSVGITVTDNVELNWSKYIVSTSNTATPNVTINNGSATATVTSTNSTGTYYVITKGCDKLNNCRTIVSQPYSIDNTKPVIQSVGVSGRTTTIRATDDVQLAYFEVYNSSGTKLNTTNFDCSNKKDCTKTYDNNVGGTYTLKVYDHLGNMSQTTFTIPKVRVTFASNNTSMGTLNPTTVDVNYGTNAQSTATPASGHKIKSVSSNCTLSGNIVTASNVTSARTCTVTFEKNEFTVQFVSADTDMGTVGTASQKVIYNNTGTTTVSPKAYHKVKNISCTNGMTATYNASTGKATTSAITTDTKCTVYFECNITSAFTYNYSGAVQSFTVPKACAGTYTLEVWGAAGGYNGGKGGYSKGTVSLSAGTTLYIFVGGAGDRGNGGYNGGGRGGSSSYERGSGGGATHIGKTNALLKDTASSNLYIVAGGGGGGTVNEGGGDGLCSWVAPSSAVGGAGSGGKYGSIDGNGGAGGGTGYTEGCGNNCISKLAGGGTQSAGGAVGVGYDCMNPPTRYTGPNPGSYGKGGDGDDWRPGGGGGYYGGGSAGVAADYTAGGGGGSGYFGSGVTPTGSAKGTQSGNGKAVITKN